MRFSAITGIVFALTAVCAAQNGANWGYEGKTGPLVWGKLDPSYQACSKGHGQSPLDIRSAHLNRSLQPLEFQYKAGGLTLENTGKGIIARVDKGSWLTAGGVRYQLTALEFHHPSEHSVKGRLSDMEVDLVHRSDDGKMAIVAVRLNSDQDVANSLLASLWQHLPQSAGKQETINDLLNPAGLLPGDRGYWTYTGSTLTPPCSEGVQWFVLEQSLEMSRSQLRAIQSLYRMNTRPAQELHGRKIEANE